MAALKELMRASVFYLYIGHATFSMAFKAYAYGLYGNEPDAGDIGQSVDEARDWVEYHCGSYSGTVAEVCQRYRELAEAEVVTAGRLMERDEPENFEGFLDLVEMLGLRDVFERLYRGDGE